MEQLTLNIPGTSGTITLDGPTVKPGFSTLPEIISTLLPVLFTIAGLILLGMIVWGGYDLLLSQGDPAKAQSAKGKITNGFIGFIIIFCAYWIAQFVINILHLTS